MRKHVIYLHGALDAGAGFVTASAILPGGALGRACQRYGFELHHPIADWQPLPIYWHREPLLHQVLDYAKQAQDKNEPVFLAGHSLGGRGALLIARDHPQYFKAVGAIAPALGEGPIDGPALLHQESFTPQDLKEELKASSMPAFIGYSHQDLVVGPHRYSFIGIDDPAKKRKVKQYTFSLAALPGIPVPVPAHNLLIGASADDLLSFFASL